MSPINSLSAIVLDNLASSPYPRETATLNYANGTGTRESHGYPSFRQSDVTYGESTEARTIYTVVSMCCLMGLATMLGCRARQLKLNNILMINVVRASVVLMYVMGIFFVFAAAVVEIGLGLSTPAVCQAAIFVCLVFYMASKLFMYIFLIERIHILRSPYSNRTRDWVWVGGMVSLAVGFGGIAIIGFIWPMADLSVEDGKCRIGLPLKVSVPLLTFDVAVNVALTAVFIYLLRPLLTLGSNSVTSSSAVAKAVSIASWALGIGKRHSDQEHPSNAALLKRVKKLLWKSLLGMLLVLLPTMANLTVLYTFQGRELGWVCFTICTLDITWGVSIVHWLTMDPMEMDGRNPSLELADSSSITTSVGSPGVRC
ncbi:hypothetical protein EJ05DRAFT_79515 [Pseudovirgaria hyperparasitica]|uniref:G-protein coupled receptors family 3 profile domain-containing protein n=1 Tax=Pseudovirgaria hyperparasitica TaxID=470096 RepID=A0A6A6VYX0_9PEZI|nr:uncharacterized protein EJ05DRAFT_79515 [Pseudovirgaria hyperparasitica]KAF2755842.1 hypothetical protein EJ05DRAFT_79515 [Pseudovirgaria hyperparasitica]